MGPAFSWRLAWCYLWTRWVCVLGMVGVAVSVWAMIVVHAVFTGFISGIRGDVRNSSPDLLLTSLPHDTAYEPLRALLAAERPDVQAVAPRLRHYGVFQERDQGRTHSEALEFSRLNTNYVQLLGVDPAAELLVTPLRDWLERGQARRSQLFAQQPPELGADFAVPAEDEWRARRRFDLPVPALAQFVPRWPGILLGSDRTRQHPLLQLGDPLDVASVGFTGPSAGGPAGRVTPLKRTFAFAGAFRTGARLFDESTAIVAIEPLRTMLGHDKMDDAAVELVTDVAIRARDGMTDDQLTALAARLQQRVRPALPPDNHAEVLTWAQQNPVFLNAVAYERAMMMFVVFAVMVVAAFLIFATLHMMVKQKVKDIGILTALGGAPRAVGGTFTRCSTVIGAIGCSVGVVGGVATMLALNPLNDWLFAHFGVEIFSRNLFDLPQIPWHIEPWWVVVVVLLASALTRFAAWWPARQASHLHPVQALAFE